MKVYFHTRRQADLPADTDWLTPGETNVLRGLKFPKRRQDWLLGRWTAKSALQRLSRVQRSLSDWQIAAAEDGAPIISFCGNSSEFHLSLSHSNGHSLCVLVLDTPRVGCDLERIEERSRTFEETFFTASELKLLEQHPSNRRAGLVTLIWSAKESVLKALRKGLKADTRRISIHSVTPEQPGHWSAFEAMDKHGGDSFHGWWRIREDMVLTVASDCHMDQPTAL